MAERWQPEALPIDSSSFETFLITEAFVLLHFWAEWDSYDRQLDFALRPVRAKFGDRVAFRSVDIDQPGCASMCLACEIVNVPSLVGFAHGRREMTVVGLRTTVELFRLVSELITFPFP